eukprot:6192045-Pleurochrysis_carterae.AAC.2
MHKWRRYADLRTEQRIQRPRCGRTLSLASPWRIFAELTSTLSVRRALEGGDGAVPPRVGIGDGRTSRCEAERGKVQLTLRA